MILDEDNYSIISKRFFDELIKKRIIEETYLYHFIIVVYKDKNNIKKMKIDNINELDLLKECDVLYKYYIKKCHYYSEFNNIFYVEGQPHYIYGVGCFLIGGDIPANKEDIQKTKMMFKKYNDKYNKNLIKINDKEFLSLNNSVINF